jgi:hypothetical protein
MAPPGFPRGYEVSDDESGPGVGLVWFMQYLLFIIIVFNKCRYR